MAAELEKPRITEIQVRMDCNGCVQKIKKTLHGINGIYEVYIDFPKQKITIVGRADLEKIIKAIKKTRKSVVICSHTEQPPDPSPPSQPPPEGGAPPPEPSNPPPPEAKQPPEEPANGPLPGNQQAEENQSPESTETEQTTSKSQDVEKVHVIYHYPPDYGYAGQWNSHATDPRLFRHEPTPFLPIYVSHHSYNSYRASPNVTRYEYVQSLLSPRDTHYGRPVEHYYETTTEEYYHYRDDSNNNGTIDSVFSEENPNSCTIV